MALFQRLPSIIFIMAILFCQSVFAVATFSQGYEAAQAGDYARAVNIWEPLAENGDAAAQYSLAWLYESALGVEKDLKQAAHWYTKAAEQGDAAAQYVLATIYEKGKGVEVNQQQAVKWYLKAANQGDAISQYQLGVHYQKGLGVNQNESDSFLWFSKSAAQGHLTAQISLGTIYQFGKGTKQDYRKAIYWYEKVAAQGDALAQFHLAHMHEFGRGVPQNHEAAKSLYLQSANKYYAPSAFKMGEFYEQGKGGGIDFNQALVWYKQAASKGNSAAQFRLGQMYESGKGVTQNILTAVEWYDNAAQQSHAQAIYQLGVIYNQGATNRYGTPVIRTNYDKAAIYYQKASQLDYPLAHARLALLYENGLGVPIDLKQAVSLYQKSTEPWAKERFISLNARQQCLASASSKLFSVLLACADRETLRKEIKATGIAVIEENNYHRSDTYYTGAVMRGSSQLKVTYTLDNLFVSATYTFVGRSKPQLIAEVKEKYSSKYGQPNLQKGEVNQGKARFHWQLADRIELIINREWPDTTTFVTYLFPKHRLLLEKQQTQSAKQIN